MFRALLLTLLAILPAAAQTASPDAQLTLALLNEIRALRQDLQNTAVTIQRVQIVMYRLQAQTALVTRATQRLDDARNRCTQSQNMRKMMTTQIEQMEGTIRDTQNPVERKQAQDRLPMLKSNLENYTNEEQQCHSRESDADSQLRAEKAKMSDLEDQLDKLDKVLSSVGK